MKKFNKFTIMVLLLLIIVEMSNTKFTLPYEISAQKCKEFNNNSICERKALPLIVGGTEAKLNEFPYMALIGYGKENVEWDCGGSLISEKFVLTAAHCAKSNENEKATFVMVGIVKRDQILNRQLRDVAKIIVYPKYRRPLKYDDIALIQMQKPVQFNEHVRPICLNIRKPDFSQDHLTAKAIGFGKTGFIKSIGSNNLLKVELQVLENQVCQPFFRTSRRVMPRGLSKNMICAGVLEGGKDTCQGDSGGPLTIYDDEICSEVLIGVISFGKFCGFAKSPSIYTNVYRYVPWIVKHVWK